VKTPVVKVVVMEGGEAREGVPGECMRSESMPGDDVRPHHVAAEAVTGKSVAAKAGVPAEATVPAASAAMTATAAVTAPAAMCDGAARPHRCAEHNGRGEHNGHLQPHESLTSLSSVVGSLSGPPANLRIVIVAGMRCRLPYQLEFPSPRDEEACALSHKQMSRAAQITNATFPDTDVSFQVGGLCYLLLPA
jgi:hypothetical protein